MMFILLIIIGTVHFSVHSILVIEVCVCMLRNSLMNMSFLLATFACCCYPCYIAKIADRLDEHCATVWINPCALMALRTKIRTAFHIRVKTDRSDLDMFIEEKFAFREV